MVFDVMGRKIQVRKKKLSGLYGYYDRAERYVAIDRELEGEELLDTALHELIHAFLDRLQIHLPDETEEFIASNLPEVLLANFKISL